MQFREKRQEVVVLLNDGPHSSRHISTNTRLWYFITGTPNKRTIDVMDRLFGENNWHGGLSPIRNVGARRVEHGSIFRAYWRSKMVSTLSDDS